MKLTVRTPLPGDAPAIADLHVATWKEAYSHLLPDDFFSDADVENRHRMWNQVLANPRDDMTVRVAESDGAIVGFAWVGPGIGLAGEEPVRDRQLYAIYVAAAHYGTGAGQALIEAALGQAPACGIALSR